jgi:hypothetical protein
MSFIFTTFAADDTSSVKTTGVTAGIFSPNDTGSLLQIFTSSVQATGPSGIYYYDLYHTASTAGGEVQFSVAYGHIEGSGSPQLNQRADSLLPTKAIYSQYKNMLLPSGSKFTFGDVQSNDIYVINFNRARMKQSIDPGNWQLGLSGSNGVRTFIDASGLGTSVTGNVLASNVYAVRSGSIATGIATGDTTVYGLVFPDNGVIVLNPFAISSSVGFRPPVENARNSAGPFAPFVGTLTTPFNYQYQHEGLVRSISGSMAAGTPFQARSVETITSQNYFVRLKNGKYNHTNNPSFYKTENGLRIPLEVFQERPLTYPTTIGLYNDANELLAVAKLSRPLQKNDERELLIRVRLDY